MRIVPRSEWGARYANGVRPAALPCKGGPILHHSVTAAIDGAGAVRALEDIGEGRFGAGISYTFPITPDGTVYEGHSVDREGAHTRGFNQSHRAICLVGNYEIDDPTDAQLDSIVELVRHGHDQGWWPLEITGGHRDMAGASTACPGSKLHARIGDLRARLTEDDMTPDQAKLLNDTHVLATAAADGVAEIAALIVPLLKERDGVDFARLQGLVARAARPDPKALAKAIAAADDGLDAAVVERALRKVLLDAGTED